MEVTAREDAMSVRLLLTAGLAALLLSGCRHDPHMQLYIDNVNAEKRLLEDTLYDLQYDYECSMQEVEKLRDEVAQLKSGSTTGGTSRPATDGGKQSGAPSVSGDTLFPEFPDLKPPTVESGAPTRPKPPATDGPREGTDRDGKNDPDDLEPPKLDLGDGTDGVSAAPQPLQEPAVEPASDADEQPASKPVSRWTPRAPRPPDNPPRRIDVAERPDSQGAAASSPANGSSTGAAAGAASQQAPRPQWRPYR
jgi:hypothetical protein